MLKLPQPFRKQGQQLCSDGNTAVFFDAYNVDHMHDAYQQGLAEQPVQVNEWKDAVIDALVVAHILTPENAIYPRKAVQDVIDWNCQVALDPSVSLKAQALVDSCKPVQVNAMLLSEMQIATLINKHFYVGMAPDYSHYKAFALGVLTAAKQAQPEPLITVESSLRFRLESEQQKSADLLEEVRELKGKLQQAQPERAPLGADMFWDHEDPETFGYDIETIASNYGLGDEIEIDCAKRMPGIKVRVIQSEPEGELTWERIDFQEAAHGIKQGGQHD